MPPDQLRVAHVMAGAPVGGAELFFERLCIALHDAGDAVLPAIRWNRARMARLQAAGLVPAGFGFGGWFDLLTRPRLQRHLQQFRPRAVVAWMSRAAGLVPVGPWPLVGRLGGFYDLKHYRRCDHLVGNTRALTAWIHAQGWPADRVSYLPNFAPDLATTPAADRQMLGVPTGVPLILALGRLHRNKAFDVLINALPRVPEAHLVIAGDGPERETLKALARDLGVAARVHMPGWREDAGALLAASDVLVCSSRHEPLGNIVIEGWSARRPVVACRAQGPAELIQAGSDGLLVAMEDAAALGDAIGSVLADRPAAAALVVAGRRRYEAAFAKPTVVSQWREFLDRIAHV